MDRKTYIPGLSTPQIDVTDDVASFYLPQEKVNLKEIFLLVMKNPSELERKEQKYVWAFALSKDPQKIQNHPYLTDKLKSLISLTNWQQACKNIPPVEILPSTLPLLGTTDLPFIPQSAFGLIFATKNQGEQSKAMATRNAWIKAPNLFLATLGGTKFAEPTEKLIGVMSETEAEKINDQIRILLSKKNHTAINIYDLRYEGTENSYHFLSRRWPNESPEQIADRYLNEEIGFIEAYEKLSKGTTPQDRHDAMELSWICNGATKEAILTGKHTLVKGIAKARQEELET